MCLWLLTAYHPDDTNKEETESTLTSLLRVLSDASPQCGSAHGMHEVTAISEQKGEVIRTTPMRVMLPIMKIVGDFCNLSCSYCFYNSKDQLTPHVMSDELLEKFIAEYTALFQGQLTFVWHGGEPLLAGMHFFERILELQWKYSRGHTFRNLIQTNATLVNGEWAEFFKKNDFHVGVSLDGNKESHNTHRLNNGGNGTFDAAMRGVKILRAYGLKIGFIQTVTRENATRAHEDLSFFTKEIGAQRLAINEYLDLEELNPRMQGQTANNETMTKYLRTAIDHWLETNDPNLEIREIKSFFAGAEGVFTGSCTFNGTCTGYFCVEYDGRVYPCDRLSNREELLFGNIAEKSLLEVLNGPARLHYAEKVNQIHPDCAACKWQPACHNGCTHHRTGGIDGKYYYCETRKATFAYLEETLNNWRKLHADNAANDTATGQG